MANDDLLIRAVTGIRLHNIPVEATAFRRSGLPKFYNVGGNEMTEKQMLAFWRGLMALQPNVVELRQKRET